MTTPEIQEMLEGMLNDEQTSEILHRMSVSPEKLTEFRQHMALRGAMDRDARSEAISDEEDDAVWAAVLGATGGLVTGGAASATGWLAKGAAFVATGLAGFFIGTAVDDASDDDATAIAEAERTAVVEQGVALAGMSATERLAAIDRTAITQIDTVVVYRDRVEFKTKFINVTDRSGQIADDATRAIDLTTPDAMTTRNAMSSDHDQLNGTGVNAASILGLQPSASIGLSPEARTTLDELLAATRPPLALADEQNLTSENVTDPNTVTPSRPSIIPSDPNDLVDNRASTDSPDMREPKADDPSDASAVPAISLMADGFEIGYSERIGRVAPAPTADNVEPDFDARAVDLTYRMLDGRFGIGGRFMYGSFAQVTLDEQVWSGLGVSDTVFAATLAPVTEFYTEGYLNYRQPLFTERLALDVGVSFGLSSSRYKVGADFTAIYLITDWLGAQAGVGYGNYWYTTQKLRQDALDAHENAGITDDLTDFYRGSMIEGRYGLFIRL